MITAKTKLWDATKGALATKGYEDMNKHQAKLNQSCCSRQCIQ
ncbi:MAG: hypothetical protein ABR595_00075 [Psychroflexus sp.]